MKFHFFIWSVVGSIGFSGSLFLGCQARPKSERTIQVVGGQDRSDRVTQSTTPAPILGADRVLQSLKLARVLIAGLTAGDLPDVPGCRQWTRDAGILTFIDCVRGKVSLSGQATLRRNPAGELQGFDLEMNVTEFDREGSRLVQTKTKIDLDISQLQPIGRAAADAPAAGGEQRYEGALRLTEEGEDLGKKKRHLELMASKAHFDFQGALLQGVRLLGQSSVKLQREKTRVNAALWVIQGEALAFQPNAGFWKGGLSFAESQDSGVPRTDVVFGEGMISVPQVKDYPVFCRVESSKLEELTCLLSNLHRSGPGQ